MSSRPLEMIELQANDRPGSAWRAEFRYLVNFSRANRGFALGLGVVALSLIAAAIGPLISPYPPEGRTPGFGLAPPSPAHWFGTDQIGMDVFSRVIAAPRVDLLIAITSTVLTLALGVPLGVLSAVGGRAGSLLGELLLRLMDVVQSFPVFILALALVAALGPNIINIIVALTVLQFPVVLRLTRSAALVSFQRLFVDASRCAGASEAVIALRHVLPNSLAPALIGASVSVAQAILITAGLSFVGAGVRIPTAEWGAMISSGSQTMIIGAWWPAVFPGLALGVTVLGYALVGDGLRVYLDPTRR